MVDLSQHEPPQCSYTAESSLPQAQLNHVNQGQGSNACTPAAKGRVRDKALLRLLYDGKQDDHVLLIWGMSADGERKKSSWFTDPDEATEYAESVRELYNVYFEIGLAAKAGGEHNRIPSNEVVAIPCLWADIDIAGPHHTKTNLPATLEEALDFINSLPLIPTIIVHSSGGLHVYWKFVELWEFDTVTERERGAKLEADWIDTIRTLGRRHGWDIDSVKDLARVLRVPDTWNHKDTPPQPVRLLEYHEGRIYNPSDFEDHLLPLMATPGSQSSSPALPSAAPIVIDDIVLDPVAKPPFDKFQAALENDRKFRLSWERKRRDLCDTSPSSYDMSLANLAVGYGWTDQEIVNLLIAGRRHNKEQLKIDRVDYYKRTLLHARQSMHLIVSPAFDERSTRVSGNQKVIADSEAISNNHPTETSSPVPKEQNTYTLDEAIQLLDGIHDVGELVPTVIDHADDLAQLPLADYAKLKHRIRRKLGRLPGIREIDDAVGLARTCRREVSATGCQVGPAIRNHRIEERVNEKGHSSKHVIVVPIDETIESLLMETRGWPKCASSVLFVDENGTLRFLDSADASFAWMKEEFLGHVFWREGIAADGCALTTKGEFFVQLGVKAEQFTAVEPYPHVPSLPRHYYAWVPPHDYVADGRYLQRLLALFDNAETPIDAALLKALFLTPAWGGLPGTRPAFAILGQDRGCGKSTLADVLGSLYGGVIEYLPNRKGEEEFVSRLLSPAALTKRVVRIDNVKQTVSSQLLESLITTPEINGKRMFYGDAARPNTLTWIITGNGLSLSRDMAERCYIIRLRRPTPRPEWREEVMRFVDEQRSHILADIVAELTRPITKMPVSDRWAAFAAAILPRCIDDVEAVIALTRERRCGSDEEIAMCEFIMQALADEAPRAVIRSGQPFFPSTQMTDIVRKALGTQWSTMQVVLWLKGHIDAGRLPQLRHERSNGCNGFVVQRQPDTP